MSIPRPNPNRAHSSILDCGIPSIRCPDAPGIITVTGEIVQGDIDLHFGYTRLRNCGVEIGHVYRDCGVYYCYNLGTIRLFAVGLKCEFVSIAQGLVLLLAKERHDTSLSGFGSLALSHDRLLLWHRFIFGKRLPCRFLPSDCA